MGVSQKMLGHWYDGLDTNTHSLSHPLSRRFHPVSPETIALQEHSQTQVVLAVKLHGDNPVGTKARLVEEWGCSLSERCCKNSLPGADTGVGGIAGLSRGAAKEHTESLVVDGVQTVQLETQHSSDSKQRQR